MDRNVVIGIAGGVVLVVALAAVLIAESGNTPDTVLTYPVTWSVAEAGTTRQELNLSEGEETTVQLPLQANNVTSVEVLIQWTDDRGNPDTFNLSVVGPQGRFVASERSDSGEVRLRFEVASAPTANEARGVDRASAARALAEGATQADGRGTWSATIVLESAPGQRPVPNVPELEVEPDGANSFTLQFTYNVYRAQLGEPQPPA